MLTHSCKTHKYVLGQLISPRPHTEFVSFRSISKSSGLKGMLAGKKLTSNEEVIAKSDVYLKAKEKSYYINGIEKLKRTLLNEKHKFGRKKMFTVVGRGLFNGPVMYMWEAA